MRRSVFLGFVIGALVVVVHRSPASAEFAVCNASSHATVNIAYAATWTDSAGNPHGQSQGWYQIDKGKCTIIISTLDVSAYTIYLYGFENVDSAKTYWGGDVDYCLDPSKKFFYQGNAMLTPCASGKSYSMRLVTSGGINPYTYYLRD